MFVNHFEQWVALCTVGRVTKVIILFTGMALLMHGTYYRARGQLLIGGILTLFPSTLHYSLVTLFALTTSAESLEIIAYVPLIQFEKWQEAQEVIIKGLTLVGFFAIGTGICGIWQHYYQPSQRLRLTDCLLLNCVGFTFIYFTEITNCVSRMIDKIS